MKMKHANKLRKEVREQTIKEILEIIENFKNEIQSYPFPIYNEIPLMEFIDEELKQKIQALQKQNGNRGSCRNNLPVLVTPADTNIHTNIRNELEKGYDDARLLDSVRRTTEKDKLKCVKEKQRSEIE